MDIEFLLKKENRRAEQFVPQERLAFGALRTDHMFIMEYVKGSWVNPRIVEYQPLSVMPGSVGLQYGQNIFEGAKAFSHADGEIYTFRIDCNTKRMNQSAKRMCMPQIPQEDQAEAIESLLDVERLWMPQAQGASLYIRPTMVAVSDALGVRPSAEYLYFVFLSPSGPYYQEGFKPIDIFLTHKFKRAAPGGVGAAKTAANYAASLFPCEIARALGCQQVLYTDVSSQFIEETGAMNHYQVDRLGRVFIPAFTDTILRSITARSIIELGSRMGIDVSQKRLRVDDFLRGISDGEITEAGGLGTAAVVAPVGRYCSLRDEQQQGMLLMDAHNGMDAEQLRKKYCDVHIVGDKETGPISQRMYQTLTDIQYGRARSPAGWMRMVARKEHANRGRVWQKAQPLSL